MDMNLDFHGLYSFIFNFLILISNNFRRSVVVKKTLNTDRITRETLYLISQDGHCLLEWTLYLVAILFKNFIWLNFIFISVINQIDAQ